MITVHGLLGMPSVELRVAAATADRVVGGRRHLDALDVEPERRIVLGALRPAVERIAALPESTQVVVVASGDPLYFGVVRALRSHGLRPEVVTAPSSIATAFAAVGLPWDDAVVVSVHGRPLAPALNLARALPKVAVFTSAEHGIRELAAGLEGLDRWFVLAERLGEPDARVRVLDAATAAVIEPVEPNVVLILAAVPDKLDTDWAGSIAQPARPPRPQVSAAAAVAFVRLLPEPGELLWACGPLAAEVTALAEWAGAATRLFEPVETEAGALRDAGGSFLTAGSSGSAGEAELSEDRAEFRPPPVPDDRADSPLPTVPEERASRRAAVTFAPDLVVADAANALAVLNGRSPRAVVLTGAAPADLPGGYRWSSESVGDHQLTTGVLA